MIDETKDHVRQNSQSAQIQNAADAIREAAVIQLAALQSAVARLTSDLDDARIRLSRVADLIRTACTAETETVSRITVDALVAWREEFDRVTYVPPAAPKGMP